MIKSIYPQKEKLIAMETEYNQPCYQVLYSKIHVVLSFRI